MLLRSICHDRGDGTTGSLRKPASPRPDNGWTQSFPKERMARSILFVRPACSVMAVPHLNLLADAGRHGEGGALTPSCNPLPLSHDRLVCALVATVVGPEACPSPLWGSGRNSLLAGLHFEKSRRCKLGPERLRLTSHVISSLWFFERSACALDCL